MKLYVVSSDDYDRGWGAEIYLHGIFDSFDKAKECVTKLPKGDMVSKYDKYIHELELNEACSKLLG